MFSFNATLPFSIQVEMGYSQGDLPPYGNPLRLARLSGGIFECGAHEN